MKNITRNLVISSLLIALSILLTRVFSFTFPVLGFSASRLSIGYVPIILAGIIMGPVWGMAVGAIADVTGFAISTSPFPYSPLITVTSMLVGLLPYLSMKVFRFKAAKWNVFLSIGITIILCSLFCQTFALSLLMSVPFWAMFIGRLPVILVITPVYCLIVYYILYGLQRAKLVPERLGSRTDERA